MENIYTKNIVSNNIQHRLSSYQKPTQNSNKITQQLTLSNQTNTFGLNPLVDAAAKLFTIAGKLQQMTSCGQIKKLNVDVLTEINLFQETINHLNYDPEHILASRYAICATLDDIVRQTPWGDNNDWEYYCTSNTLETPQNEQTRFFIILDRILQQPKKYIDLMEFMYICLSMGFKGGYQATEFGYNKLEQITDALYRKIRAQNGDFNRTLSPHIYKYKNTKPQPEKDKNFSLSWPLIGSALSILTIFLCLGLSLNFITQKTQAQLTKIGNISGYEIKKTKQTN